VTLIVLLMVLASALLHATWNLWAKQIGGRYPGAAQAFLLTVLSALFYAPVGLWGIATGAWRPGPDIVPWVAGSAVLHVVYFLLLLRGYRHADLSLVYPLARGTGPLLAAAGAVAFLAERPSPLAIGGALLVTAGVLVLTLPGRGIRPPPPGGSHAIAAGVRYGLATGVCIALYTLWDSAAVKRAGMSPLFYYWAGEMVRVVLFAPLALRHRGATSRLWREQRWRIVGIAALSPLAYILILLAFRVGPVTHIAPAREISILFGTWFGARVLGEGDKRRRLIAAFAFALGVMALATG
jgi:drug/metabolite transporter (DMT)-like permease